MSEETEYFIVSVKWTERKNPYITLWGPNDSGYRARVGTSGRYAKSEVMKNLSYYNNSYHTLAVPCDLLEGFAVDITPGWIDGDGGMWVPNKKAVWDAILANAIRKPTKKAKPRYRGAPRSHDRDSE